MLVAVLNLDRNKHQVSVQKRPAVLSAGPFRENVCPAILCLFATSGLLFAAGLVALGLFFAAPGLLGFAAGLACGNGCGSLDGFLPRLHGFAFGGLDGNHLLYCNVRNGNFAFLFAALRLLLLAAGLVAFGLLLAALCFFSALCLFFATLRLLLFAAGLVAFGLLLAALGFFSAFCLFFAALRLLLFAAGLLAALGLQGYDDLAVLANLCADDLAAFDLVSLGAHRLGIDGLGILNHNGSNLVGTGNNRGDLLLAAATTRHSKCANRRTYCTKC